MDFFSNRSEDLHLLDPHIPLPILRGFAPLHKRNRLLDHGQVSRDYLHGWSLLRLDDPYSRACDGLAIDDLDVLSLP